jgi:hypothetical protein
MGNGSSKGRGTNQQNTGSVTPAGPLLLRVWLPHLQQPVNTSPLQSQPRGTSATHPVQPQHQQPQQQEKAAVSGHEFTATAQELPDVLVGYAVKAWLLRLRQHH